MLWSNILSILHKDKSSFGLSLGIRSLYQGNLAGGGTGFGEGISSGFRWDYKLGNLMGLAIGAEQFIQFDDKTDTGRDIYLSISKAFLNKNKEKIFHSLLLLEVLGQVISHYGIKQSLLALICLMGQL